MALAALVLVLAAAACGGSGEDAAEPVEREPVVPDHEVTGLGTWFNSEPFTIAEQLNRGNIVLIDFWTYTCINCVRTLPYLRDWHEKYAGVGLVILGVHSPEFDFEYDAENVAEAIERLGVLWPVAQDNDFRTWREFENNYWPAKYLFGPGGDVVYQHFGEGDYEETERFIRVALTAAGHDVSGVSGGLAAPEPERDPNARDQTRELYGGYARNYTRQGVYAAQVEYYDGPDEERLYSDIDTTEQPRVHHRWYVHGLWRNEREAIVHARQTEALEDYFALVFPRAQRERGARPASRRAVRGGDRDRRPPAASRGGRRGRGLRRRGAQPDPRGRAAPLRDRRAAGVGRARAHAGLELRQLRDLRAHVRQLPRGGVRAPPEPPLRYRRHSPHRRRGRADVDLRGCAASGPNAYP